jgi:hypothetical protein
MRLFIAILSVRMKARIQKSMGVIMTGTGLLTSFRRFLARILFLNEETIQYILLCLSFLLCLLWGFTRSSCVRPFAGVERSEASMAERSRTATELDQRFADRQSEFDSNESDFEVRFANLFGREFVPKERE